MISSGPLALSEPSVSQEEHDKLSVHCAVSAVPRSCSRVAHKGDRLERYQFAKPLYCVVFCLALMSTTFAQTRTKDSSADRTTLPPGTQIKVTVDLPDRTIEVPRVVTGKVSVPIRNGFSTLIPALSRATVQFTPTRYGNAHGRRKLIDVAELTSLTVNGNSYDVRTDPVPLVFGTVGTNTEVTFTLSEALDIER